jgi:hypothetical protein
MRLGVIGHQGYDELPDILHTLFRVAPGLAIEPLSLIHILTLPTICSV